ncbi:MAG: T9SS type A sorting domain-containing protein, partial [Taibaiella sp.]|nr:T9SS type A sorting domain-containing protein [Taibaiella sp.]
KDIHPGSASSTPEFLNEYNGKLIFKARVRTYGNELWISDGTPGGTNLVKDIVPGSFDGVAVLKWGALNSKLYFIGMDAVYNTELWTTDGTSAGTMRVTDLNPGFGASMVGAGFYDICTYNNMLYFSGRNDTSGVELFTSDGTTTGTKLLKDINPLPKYNSMPRYFHVYHNKLYFQAGTAFNYTELWATDGTTAGTRMVKDIFPGQNPSNPHAFANYGNKMYFIAQVLYTYFRLFVTDGTDSNTVSIEPPGSSSYASIDSGSTLVVCDNKLFFSAKFNSINELWLLRDSTVGVEAEIAPDAASLFSISPNPAHNYFTIHTEKTFKQGQVVITDITGRPVKTSGLTAPSSVISLQNMSRGIYLVTVQLDGKRGTQRLILE